MTSPSKKSLKDRLAAKKIDSPAAEDSIKVHLPQNDIWRVELFIPFEEMSPDRLTAILRVAKTKISQRDHIPIGLLSYEDLMDKETQTEGYRIAAKIVKCEVETGDPVLRFFSAANEGVEYPDMAIFLDIYPKTKSGEEIKLKIITALLAQEKIEPEKVNLKVIEDALTMVKRDMVAIRNLLLAQGRFPDPSEDARLEFFHRFRDYDKGSFIGVEKIDPEQPILKLIPSLKGEKDGFTVRGEKLPPRIPQAIELFAGDGIKIVKDCDVYSLEMGLPIITEIASAKGLTKLKVSLEKLDIVDGSAKLEITTENHLQINGGLKSGSQIIARGEVFIEGDVENNTMISAVGDVKVTGKIQGGSISSERNIESASDVHSCRLMANGTLTIAGTARNSQLIGYEVHSQQVVGCEIKVGVKSVIDTITADEKGFTTKITAGMVEHLKEKIIENKKFIDYASKNLKKFEAIVGGEIVQEATPSNVSRMTILYVRDVKMHGVKAMSKVRMDALKKLIEAIGPIRETMQEKERAVNLYEAQVKKDDKTSPEISIKNKIEAPVEINIKGLEGKIEPQKGPIVIREGGGEFVVDTAKEEGEE